MESFIKNPKKLEQYVNQPEVIRLCGSIYVNFGPH